MNEWSFMVSGGRGRLEREGDREKEEQGSPMRHKWSWKCPSCWTLYAESEAANWHVKIKKKMFPLCHYPFDIHFFFLSWLAASPSTQTLSLIPRIYQLSAESLSVSGSQPLPSTSLCLWASSSLSAHRIASSPPSLPLPPNAPQGIMSIPSL